MNLKQITSTLVLGAALCAPVSAIPASYGSATHDTTKWQELADPIAGDQFGITWSADNGLTWGRDELFVGQTVKFRFNMHKKNVGTHYADHLKAWVDWGQDGSFDIADQIAYGEHILTDVEPTLGTNQAPTVANITYFSNEILLTAAHEGETWIRARVTCSHSIVNALGDPWSDQWNNYYTSNYESLFNPTGHYYQGETEDWKLTISSVSEPATIALLAFGLAGVVLTRRRAR